MVRPAALLILLLAAAGLRPHGDSAVLVSAAISLTDALTEAAALYEREGGGPVRFNFAGSNALARQIVNGAPADVFISADEAQMDYAARAGAIVAASRVDLLGNRLAVVTGAGRGREFPGPGALRGARRIAVGDPAAVPAGVYARQFLERAGLWRVLEPRLVPLANVRAALAAAENGAADAAIVYESDAAASRKVDVGFVVSGPDAPRIVYPAALVTRSRNAAAAKFLAFLRSARAGIVFARFKFIVPPAGD